jgi:Peptidase family M23
MRARPVRVRSMAAAVALSLLLIAMSASDARAAAGWAWPVEGAVITRYSNDDANPYAGGVHRGIDIAAPIGAAVRAARAGLVTYAGTLGYSGLTVAVRTVDGYVTSYLHLSAVGVRRGESVGGGDRLGEVGTSGRRSKPEPHLHFGVRVADERHHYVDPLSLLPPLASPDTGAPPAPVPAPVRAVPEPVPVRTTPLPRREPVARRPAPHRARVPLRLPLPAAPKRLAHGRAARSLEPARVPRTSVHARDWGRPLALAGLGVLVLALLGQSAIRAARRIGWPTPEGPRVSRLRSRWERCVRSITHAAKAVVARG